MGGNNQGQQSVTAYGSPYGGAAQGMNPQFSFTPEGNSQVVRADPFQDSFELLMDDLYQRMKARAANDSDQTNPFFAPEIGWQPTSGDNMIGF